MILCQMLWKHPNCFQYPSLIFLSSYQRATPKFGPKKKSGRIWCCLLSFPFPISWGGVDCFRNSMVRLSPPTISETHSQTWTGLYYSPPLLFSNLTQLATLLYVFFRPRRFCFLSVKSFPKRLRKHSSNTWALSSSDNEIWISSSFISRKCCIPSIRCCSILFIFHWLQRDKNKLNDLPNGKRQKDFSVETFWQ